MRLYALIIFTVCLLMTVCSTVFGAYEPRAHVTIMETTDLHGHISPTSKSDNFGLAKIATLIKQVRSRHPDALLIDDGDVIQGTPLSYYHARVDNRPIDPMMLVMNDLHYQAMTMGNHEFNFGRSVREKARKEATFPWLSANTLIKGTDQVYTEPYKIIEMKNGIRVGILGLTTQKIAKWEEQAKIADLSFQDVVIAAKKWVPIMKNKEHADVIVVAYHGGLEHKKAADGKVIPLSATNGENQAYQLATEVPGIDVILAGHMHTLLAKVFVNGVLITEPNKWGTHLAVVDLDLQKKQGNWQVASKNSKLIPATVAPDLKVLALVLPYEEKVEAFANQPLGKIKGNMIVKDPHYVRTHDTALIEWINKVQMEATGTTISATSLFKNNARGFHPEVTYRDILETYPYLNTLHVLEVKGSDIKAALERSASYFKQNTGTEPVEVNPLYLIPKAHHDIYDMWEGICYTIDVSKPERSRIVELTDTRGIKIEPNKQYHVVLNNYRASGGGNYSMFANKLVLKATTVEMPELIAQYIRSHHNISATVDHNWKIIGGLLPDEE